MYWEDLSPEEKEQHKAARRSELEAIGRLQFPVEAVFSGDPVTVLGPVHLFPPYDDPAYGKPTLSSNAQLMVRGQDGKKFIGLATSVIVNGKPLLGRNPPRRDPRDPWEKQLFGVEPWKPFGKESSEDVIRGGGQPRKLDAFTRAYVASALWADTDGKSMDDLAPQTLRSMIADAEKFQRDNAELLSERDEGQGGHDFWLTRNGHGAGFWDGDWPEPAGKLLTWAAKSYGPFELYEGDDGKIYAVGHERGGLRRVKESVYRPFEPELISWLEKLAGRYSLREGDVDGLSPAPQSAVRQLLAARLIEPDPNDTRNDRRIVLTDAGREALRTRRVSGRPGRPAKENPTTATRASWADRFEQISKRPEAAEVYQAGIVLHDFLLEQGADQDEVDHFDGLIEYLVETIEHDRPDERAFKQLVAELRGQPYKDLILDVRAVPIPKELSPRGKQAARAIRDFLKKKGLTYSGGGFSFRTPEQARRQWSDWISDPGPESSVLFYFSHEGGEPPLAFSYDEGDYETIEAMVRALKPLGFYTEQVTSWLSVLLDDGGPRKKGRKRTVRRRRPSGEENSARRQPIAPFDPTVESPYQKGFRAGHDAALRGEPYKNAPGDEDFRLGYMYGYRGVTDNERGQFARRKPEAARENPVEVEDGIPWVKVERDPDQHAELFELAKQNGPITGARDVYTLLEPWANKQDQESFVVVMLDIHSDLRGVSQIHIGSRDRVAVDRSDVLRPVLKQGAKGFIVCHNHPSGHAQPSPADRDLTKALKAGADEVDISFIDHVVLGTGEYYSFAEKKLHKVR